MLNRTDKRVAYGRAAVTICGIVVACGLLVSLAVWVSELPGPLHGAYLAYASLTNIRSRLQAYDALIGRLPASARTNSQRGRTVSWRVEICRQDQNRTASFDYDCDKNWNDPANLRFKVAGTSLFQYTQTEPCPPHHKTGRTGIYTTYYKAITGPDTAFDSSPHSLKDLPNDLILVVRVEHSDTHWMEPGDLDVKDLKPVAETKDLLLGDVGYVVLFADGEPWVLSGKTPLADLCKFFTITGARQFDREKLLGPYRILPR